MTSILWSLGAVYAFSILIIVALALLCVVSTRARKHVFA